MSGRHRQQEADFRRFDGGRIDRGQPLSFFFDERELTAYRGDTLASALLANGVRVVASGPYTGRPRGVVSAGSEEPSAVVQVDSGVGEPMVTATTVEVYEGLRASSLAGKGRLDDAAPVDARYDKIWEHCDVLVVGGGRAGLSAALAAASDGARVILADEQPEFGGRLLTGRSEVDGQAGMAWVGSVADRLAELTEVRVLPRTTVVGYYDHDFLIAVERRTDHLGTAAPPHVSRQRLWHIRAGRVILATGAHERPIVFPDNDRPGVMLAGAAATYAWRYGVLPSRRAVVFSAHDGALGSALDLLAAGVDVPLVVDVRSEVDPRLAAELGARGAELRLGHAVLGTAADEHGCVSAAVVSTESSAETVGCDLVAVSGGLNPTVSLFSQSGGALVWSDAAAAFVPGAATQAVTVVGAATGVRSDASPPAAFFAVEEADDAASVSIVDLQRDSTLRDLRRAVGAGLTSSEHVKRFTTIGTAADQGKTSGVVTVGLLARTRGRPVAEVGTTTYRPPYVPMSFALLAGRDRGLLADPERVSPIQAWHVAHGAVFEDVGQWKRPRYFPRDGEEMEQAVLRECTAARTGVAVMDASTLGKIDIQGPDVGIFLDRIYTNTFSTLSVGKVRYGLMCKADGMIFDDGTTARIADDRYVMTTTTGNAAAVLDWLEEWLQTEWPDLRVHCTSVTDHWTTVAVVGPRSREVLATLAPDLDVSTEGFRFMEYRTATVAGIPARVFRVSFSGELAYEINVEGWYGQSLWEAVMATGEPHGITPYGTETMHVLRAEKGFPIVGQDTDGTVTPDDLGMGWAVATKKEFVGKRSLRRPDTARDDRKQLVGLLPDDPSIVLTEGAQLVADPNGARPVPMEGHVTSSYRSAALGRSFALALVRGGSARHGERLQAVDRDSVVPVVLTEPVFYDREGARRDG